MKMFTIVQGAAFLSMLGQLSTVIAETAAPTTPVPTTGLPTTPTPTTTGTIGAWDFFYTTRKGFADTTETRLFAHGGGIIKEGDTFYMHGQVFNANVTDNTFAGFSMYSSKNQQTWTWQNEGLILPSQPTGELTSARKGERPHIVKCPKTGEFVLFAHAASADYQDNEIVYATSKKVNGTYAYKGPLKNSKGALAHQKDINTLVDGKVVYVVAEGGDVYKLSSDCHSWTTHTTHPAVNGDEGVLQAPIAIKVGSMYYWIGSRKSDQGFSHFYSTAPAMTGPWTFRGSLHASSASQGSWIESIIGSESSTYVFWRDAWGPYTSDPDPTTSIHSLQNDQAAYELQTLAFSGTQITVTRYLDFGSLMIDYGKGTSWWVSDLTTPPPPFPKPTQAPVPRWGQCGGQGWTGSTTCDESSCVPKNSSYSQCM